MNITKFILSLLLVVGTFLVPMSQTADAAEFRTVKVVNASSLVVKAQQDTASRTVGSLQRGSFVTVFSSDGYWAYVQSGNVKGYVDEYFLADANSNIKIANSKGGLIVRATPSTSGKNVATLTYNMIINEFSSSNGWSFVQYGNITGYVVSSFIGTPRVSTKYVNSSELIVRNIASKSGANIGSLFMNDEVTVHSTLMGWSYVSDGYTQGYVVDAFLTKNAPVYYYDDYYEEDNYYGYANCTELKKDYPNGVQIGHSAYDSSMDRDNDGWACERSW